ncbi:MAG: hypothetical protein C4299_02315 [Thermoleophilia bacterium]
MDLNPILGSRRRKSAKREPWKRVKRHKFQVWQVDEPGFTGYLTRLDLLEVSPPLIAQTPDGLELCVADTGYVWTQHFPSGT